MNESRTHRPPALAALLIAAAALAAVVVHEARADRVTTHDHAAHSTALPSQLSATEFALRQEMRRLWEDHVTWTRLAIISLTTDSPDTKATVARLLRNQTDIGNAVKPYYGAAAGRALTGLLREHITIAAQLVGAAKAGDQAKVAVEQRRWQRNADEIAAFLNKANPDSWKLGEMKGMLQTHLALTTQEALNRLRGNWAADVRNYDQIHRQALGMADMLSAGIVDQFPRRFS